MKLFIMAALFLVVSLEASKVAENQTCKVCHPKIYKEYSISMHRKASIYSDVVHKAIWDKHPLKKKDNYKCGKCHTPSDKELIANNGKLKENYTQKNEPISCQHCHKIESIEKHKKSNKNVLTTKEKTFFSADSERKGQKVEFKEESSFLGLFTKTVGSPYHDIDYSNEGYYTGDVCMGCHSHKQNSKDFTICDLEVKKGDSKDTCISCHMPKVQGSVANQKMTKTHNFHGATALVAKPSMLSKYIKLSLDKNDKGFNISLKNMANHTLVPHPLRLAKLKVSIIRDSKTIELKDEAFVKVIGTGGKPSFPWLADEIIKDSSIKAFETRVIKYDTALKTGDEVIVEFGYHIVNPKIAKKLNITDEMVKKFTLLKKQKFGI